MRKYGIQATVYVNPTWMETKTVPWWFQMSGPSARACELRQRVRNAEAISNLIDQSEDSEIFPIKLLNGIMNHVPPERLDDWWNSIEAQCSLAERDSLDDYGLATWEELSSSTDVLEVGSHTNNHCVLGLCQDPDFMRLQISDSKNEIEKRIGVSCPHFAYPRGELGDYNENTRKQLIAAGHKTAVTCLPGLAVRDEDAFTIRRIFISETPVAEIAATLAGFSGKWDRMIQWLKGAMPRRASK